MNIAELTADPRNPRSIDAASASGLRYSLREFGDISGIVFNRKLERLVCGHQRLEQLKAEHGDALKLEKPRKGAATGRIKCPNGDVFGVRFVDWDEPKSWAANIAANNPAIAGTFTADLQGQLTELERLNPEDFRELRLDELQDPTTPEMVDAEPQLDRAEELREQWKVETGQLWEITGESGNVHRLMCGDSTKAEDVERLMGGDQIQLPAMITDPPYNIGTEYGEATDENRSVDEYLTWTNEWFAIARPLVECAAITVGPQNLSLWAKLDEPWFWVVSWSKPGAMLNGRMGFCHWEPVVVYGKPKHKKHDAIHAPIVVDSDLSGKHPTPKPLVLWTEILIRLTDRDDHVYDPFLGSGTTLIAAENLGRRCFGMEISPAYVAVALERATTLGCECKLDGRKQIKRKKAKPDKASGT